MGWWRISCSSRKGLVAFRRFGVVLRMWRNGIFNFTLFNLSFKKTNYHIVKAEWNIFYLEAAAHQRTLAWLIITLFKCCRSISFSLCWSNFIALRQDKKHKYWKIYTNRKVKPTHKKKRLDPASIVLFLKPINLRRPCWWDHFAVRAQFAKVSIKPRPLG